MPGGRASPVRRTVRTKAQSQKHRGTREFGTFKGIKETTAGRA